MLGCTFTPKINLTPRVSRLLSSSLTRHSEVGSLDKNRRISPKSQGTVSQKNYERLQRTISN
jgi:hypothetical protein